MNQPYFNIGDHVRFKQAAIDHYDNPSFEVLRGLLFIVDGYLIEDGHELRDFVNLRCLNKNISPIHGTHHSELELVADA